MPLLSRIFGWVPPDNSDYIEVILPTQATTCHSPTNPRKSDHISPAITGLNVQSTSPSSADQQDGCTGHESPTPVSDNKHADPTWVARPRNKFILFRCDYVRKHSSDEKHVRRGLGSKTEKSLSKQAAEAWHLLSKEDRLYWKGRATAERLEHARKYPDYRYRPKKSTMVRRRHVRFSKNNLEATSSSSKTIAPPTDSRPQSPSGSSISKCPPKHMLSVIKPTPRSSSYVPCAIGGSSNKQMKSSASLPLPNIQNIGSPYNQYTPAPMTLPLRSQIPMPFSFNTPELFSQNSFLLTNRRPSIVSSNSSSTSSLSNWNGENMDYLCGSGSSSEASMSDGLSQMISLSNFDMGLEMAVPTTNNNNTGINQSVMPEYITGDMQFAPPPSSLYQQQQQLFDNVYQADLWNTYYPMDGGMAIASQVNSNAAHAYAQHTTHGCAHAPTLASSTASIPNWFL